MSKLCVNVRDNKFISLKNKYSLASSALENIIHAWYDISDNAEYDSNEFIEFLENSLCLDKIEYTSKSKYEKAHQIWEDLNKKYSKISKNQIKEAKNTARIIFGEDNYSIYETNEDGVFSLKIKEPSQIKAATDNIGEFSTTSDNIYEENIAYNRANSTRDDKLFNLVKGETSEASIIDIIKILEDSEYSNIINLLKSRFGNRSNDDKLLNGIKIKLVNPLDYGGYTSGTVKRMFPNGKRAVYNATEKTVYIDITASYTNGDASSVIMHELMHAITVDRILSNKDARERFEKIFDEYIKGELDESTARSEKHYLEEFIANIWSDPYTINRLKSIKSSNEDKTLWDKIKEFFTDLFSGVFAGTKDDSLMVKASTEMIKLLESPVTRKATGIYEESNSQKDYKISYTPKGKYKQVYTIIGSHIYNKEGKEVFKEDSTDRNKIFANLAVSQGRAVVVEHKGSKYVVNQKGQILSTTTGRIMNWGSENGNRKAVLELANNKFNKDKTSSTKSEIVEANKLSESKALVQQIIEDSNRRIKFDKTTHTYTVDGKKADTSVTQYIHGKKDLGAWELPSSTLGNTVDTVVRDFFSGNVKKSYPNLNSKQLKSLLADCELIRKQFNKKFGEGNYEVVTTEFPVAAKYTVVEKDGTSTIKVMAGTMDMLVYDKDGNFYIYDMKTSRSGIKEDTKVGYSKQLTLYKGILESNYPQLRGKIKELNLLEFSISYPNPNNIEYYSSEDIEDGLEGQLYISDEEGGAIDIQDSSEYKAPTFKNTIPVQNINTTSLKSLDESFKESNISKAKKEIPVLDKTGWDTNPLITASERRFLSNQVMQLTSFIISQLQNNKDANQHYLGKTFKQYNFTEMARSEIIKTVGLGNIFNYIKESFFNPEVRTDIEDFDVLDKLEIAYNNFESLIRQGYSKLISLEDTPSIVSVKPKFVKREDIEESLDGEFEQGSLEEKEREYWQIGQRQLSAKASLSSEIRRLFGRLKVIDQNGKSVKDDFGFNMDTFVDPNEAINSILTWVNAATNIEEMESILSQLTEANPWLNKILEVIKEEPIRSQFFQNFRKDFLNYSVVRVEYDSNGKRQYVTEIINTQGASVTALNSITSSFKMGLMTNLIIPIKGDIEGRGRVNTESVQDIKEDVISITQNIKESFAVGQQNQVITNNINHIVDVLNKVGIPVTTNTLKSALLSDSKKKNYDFTNSKKILSSLNYMLDTLLDNKDNTTYSPMIKGEKGNIYSNYKDIITIISPYVKDSIESSTYENGKMYYSFTTPSYMGKLINNLSDKLGDANKFKDFIEREYGSYKWFKIGDTWNCPWLDRIVNNESIRQSLQHKVQLSFDKTNYTDLSELSYTLSLMTEYFYDKNKKWAWYRLPILANKPSSEFVRFERLSGTKYKNQIKKGLRKVFDQEVMRMKTVLERAGNPNIEKIGAKGKIWFDIKDIDSKLLDKVKGGRLTLNDLVKDGKYIFSGSGAEFKFLSPLNSEIINKTELGQMIVDKLNGKDVNETTLTTLFNTAVDNFMSAQMKIEKANWDRLGLFDTEEITRNNKGKKETVTKFKYVSQLGDTREEVISNLEEYVWNDMFATINIIELTATDLAYYKNVEDFQKRYSQVHAPSMRLNVSATFKDSRNKDVLYSADGLERTMYLKDSFAKSDFIPNIAKVFDNKIATLQGNQKTEMEIMKSLILQEFEDINVADAQGYSSPTSYRKKLGMQGRWSPEMEEAYQQIIEGNLNINNLGIVWQPLKPFVYSQIRKTSGASTMSELKVPVQNKNSEYLLLIADAILRSGSQVNKLSAIFDFMEESAYDNGEYNGKGIDTVQFISAVNSGGMGTIDLSKAKSYAEVKQILEDSAYYDSSKREVSDNDNDRYNEQYVHSIPFEDYGIQQEVPAHMSDHQQPMGSQVRILSVSDISKDASFNINGETYNRERLQKEYFHLIAENIKESYEQLKKDLNLKGSRLEQNQALSQLLQEEILKDQRYGYDLLIACSLDENGEFLIPLSDPIQSSRIQQLLNSIIKSRINKQRVQGGPAVQASAFGLSDDLNIVWQDEDGNLSTSNKFNIKKQKSVAYFECYAPIPTKEMERALLKSDGSYMSPQEALEKGIITDEMLKAIGYRIPTEDKYSILPLKIKGFVPKAAGEAIIMPKEITTITGSDFDIDKMYIMFKEFKQDTKTNWSQLKRDVLHRINTGKLSKPNGKGTLRSQVDIAVDEIIAGREFSEDSFEMEVFDYYNENYSKYNTTKFLEKGNNKTGDRSNKIFDIQWAVLTNADTMEKMFNPGSFNVQKKSARIITILKSSNKYTYKQLSEKKLEELNEIVESSSNLNIVFPSTQVYFHKQNMTAGKLIGIFANNNTSHAFLSMQDIEFNIQEGEGFTFDGVTIDGSNNNKIDNLRAKDGSLISKNIAGFLAASVDAVKDPVLNYMNLNTMTANPAMVLARLGFDSDSIGLLLTQPIIEFITTEYFKRNNEGYASIEDIIDEVLENSNINYSLLEKDLVNTSFTKEELAKGLKTNINTEFQIRTLLLFKKLSTMGKDLNTLTFLTKFNSVTNAVGPSIADTFVMRERHFKFLDDMGGIHPPFNENAKDVINNNEMLSAFYESTAGDSGASALIFRNYFPHYSVAFSEILEELRGTTKGNVDSKTINKLVNDFVLYKLTIGDNPVLDGSYNSRNRYINNFVREFSEYSKEILGNDFINVISIKPKSTKCPVDALESRTGGYSIDVQERIKDGWDNLIGNEDTNELGQDLFFYNLFRSGFTFSPKNPGHLASVNVRRSIPGYIEAVGNPTYEDTKVISSEFLNQFRRNHSNDIKIVPVLKPSNKIKVTFGKDVNKESTVTFTFNKFKSGMNSIIVDSNPFATTFAPVIKYEDNLYMNPISADNFVIYTKTTVLGNANNFLEYNYNEGSSMKSVINNNTSSREKTDSNSTYEVKNKKSYTEREISKAIEAVLGNTSTTIKGSKVNNITDKVLNKLGANDSFKQIVTKMVKDKLKDQC